jgi:peptidoglycan/xylan/chitin deacetylase (PgdA/CDA1 family)
MRRKFLYLAFLLIETLSFCLVAVQAQNGRQEIAITFDDLPLNGAPFEVKRLQNMTSKLLSVFTKHQVPVVGFVNESQLYIPGETDARIAILKTWVDAGVELGNHTFAHVGFANTSLAAYQDDFIRGETISNMLMKPKGQKVRYFRHPYLQMGKTQELEKSFEQFIAERGYKIAPVTIDTMDWMFLAAYLNAQKQGDMKMIEQVSQEYLKLVERRFDYSEKASIELFGRPIKHILLLHSNELNADNFEALVTLLKTRGYQFITLEQALTDPVYQSPDRYQAKSDWLSHWAFSKGKGFAPPAPPEFIQKQFEDNQKGSTAAEKK